MKKKFMAIMLILVLVLAAGLTACGGDDNGDLGDDFEYTWEYILSHLPAEFSITYRVTMNGEDGEDEFYAKVIRTSTGYYFEDEDGIESSELYIKNGDKYDQYYYDDDEETFVLNEGYPQSSQSGLDTKFMVTCGMYMSPWTGTTGFTKSDKQTIAGRSCDKYTFSVSGYGAAITYTYYIDTATGTCLKMTYFASAGGQGGGYEFE